MRLSKGSILWTSIGEKMCICSNCTSYNKLPDDVHNRDEGSISSLKRSTRKSEAACWSKHATLKWLLLCVLEGWYQREDKPQSKGNRGYQDAWGRCSWRNDLGPGVHWALQFGLTTPIRAVFCWTAGDCFRYTQYDWKCLFQKCLLFKFSVSHKDKWE